MTAEGCDPFTAFEALQWILAENGETFSATNIITTLPETVIVYYPDLTPNQPSLGTVFELV